MALLEPALSRTFKAFFDSEKAGGILLLVCTAVSLALANSPVGPAYVAFWHTAVGGLSLELWINDALMAVFFLFIGLELERELYSGELSDLRSALLPMMAAIGGALVPALIYHAFNVGQPTEGGFGIPMATDIAFAMGALALLGPAVPSSLKVFVVAFAVLDDLIAILIIAVFYTTQLSLGYLVGALVVFGLLLALNRVWHVMALTPYLLGGVIMWVFMFRSGIHATMAGVLLAFAIPFSRVAEDATSPSHRLEHVLNGPVAIAILPIFALANTAIVLGGHWLADLGSAGGLGIIVGLVIGKPLGVVLTCLACVAVGVCRLPEGLGWRHIFGAGALGGIGFTMSIFITNLAFAKNGHLIDAAKLAVLVASVVAGAIGMAWLAWVGRGTSRPGRPASGPHQEE